MLAEVLEPRGFAEAGDRSLGIYLIYCPSTGDRYIGQTRQRFVKRWQQHLNDLEDGTHSNDRLRLLYDHYGASGLVFIILEECLTELELDEREDYWTVQLNATCNEVWSDRSWIRRSSGQVIPKPGMVLGESDHQPNWSMFWSGVALLILALILLA